MLFCFCFCVQVVGCEYCVWQVVVVWCGVVFCVVFCFFLYDFVVVCMCVGCVDVYEVLQVWCVCKVFGKVYCIGDVGLQMCVVGW